jgi:hypothetical protein
MGLFNGSYISEGSKMNSKHIIILCFAILIPFLAGWGGDAHRNISQAALERVPQKQLDMFKPALDDIKNTYCLIPDLARKDAKWKPYLMGDLSLHIGDTTESNVKVYKYFTKTVCAKIKAGDIKEAAKYYGAFLHFTEDSLCPAHLRYGLQIVHGEKNKLSSLEFFKRFIYVPEKYKNENFHHLIDKGGFDLEQLKKTVGDYKPVLLGKNEAEIVAAFQTRHEAAMVNSSSQLIPMMQAICADDTEKTAEYGLAAATPAAKLAADYLYSILYICSADTAKSKPKK